MLIKLSEFSRDRLERATKSVLPKPVHITKKEVVEVAVLPLLEITPDGELIATYVDGSTANLGVVVGATGPMPDHQVSNGEVRFEKPDGSWGPWIRVTKSEIVQVGGGGADSTGGSGMNSFKDGEILAQQTGDGTVKTFNFTKTQDVVYVKTITTDNNCGVIAYADPLGGTPADGVGIPCPEGEESTELPYKCATLKVWAPANTLISVYGGRNPS